SLASNIISNRKARMPTHHGEVSCLVHIIGKVRKTYGFALFTALTRVWTTSSERRYVSPVDQRRQEGHDGYLLSASDIVPISSLCALLYGPQLCLLPKLY